MCPEWTALMATEEKTPRWTADQVLMVITAKTELQELQAFQEQMDLLDLLEIQAQWAQKDQKEILDHVGLLVSPA